MLDRPLITLLRETRNQFLFLIRVILILPIAYFNKLFFRKKPLWLIGENEGTFLGDNSYVFYLYSRNKDIKDQCYFITSKKSIKNNLHLQHDTNIIIFGSFKHILMFLLANVVIFSHSHSDIAYINILRIFNPQCKKVFLQHGITAFKKVHSIYRKGHNDMDIFIVSSHYEKKIVTQNLDFPSQIIKATGFARYDRLINDTTNSKRQILFFPTWRDWSFPPAVISIYEITIKNLLNNRLLLDILERHEVKFTYYPHSSHRNIIADIPEHKYIKKYTTNQLNLQELITSHSLLITDYSSVAWDYLYQNKPVIFYQFDQDEYVKYKGAYIDFNKDLFGDVCKTEDELLKRIEQVIINNFTPSLNSKFRRRTSFDYYDQNNCARIYESIINLEH